MFPNTMASEGRGLLSELVVSEEKGGIKNSML